MCVKRGNIFCFRDIFVLWIFLFYGYFFMDIFVLGMILFYGYFFRIHLNEMQHKEIYVNLLDFFVMYFIIFNQIS